MTTYVHEVAVQIHPDLMKYLTVQQTYFLHIWCEEELHTVARQLHACIFYCACMKCISFPYHALSDRVTLLGAGLSTLGLL